MWLGVDLKADAKKEMSSQEIGFHAQNMLSIWGSILNIIGGTYYNHLMSTGYIYFL